MLNLFNNTNNFSLFNNDLLNNGLILGSIGILGYSIYYFSGNVFRNNVDKHLTDKIQEILYGMCSEGEDLSNIDPVTFTNEIRNNPQYSGWFNTIQDWAKDIKTSSGKSFNSSELDFLKRIKDELNSTSNSPIIETNSPVTDITPLSNVSQQMQNLSDSVNTQDMLISKLFNNESFHTSVAIVNEAHLKKVLELYNITLTDSN